MFLSIFQEVHCIGRSQQYIYCVAATDNCTVEAASSPLHYGGDVAPLVQFKNSSFSVRLAAINRHYDLIWKSLSFPINIVARASLSCGDTFYQLRKHIFECICMNSWLWANLKHCHRINIQFMTIPNTGSTLYKSQWRRRFNSSIAWRHLQISLNVNEFTFMFLFHVWSIQVNRKCKLFRPFPACLLLFQMSDYAAVQSVPSFTMRPAFNSNASQYFPRAWRWNDAKILHFTFSSLEWYEREKSEKKIEKRERKCW